MPPTKKSGVKGAIVGAGQDLKFAIKKKQPEGQIASKEAERDKWQAAEAQAITDKDEYEAQVIGAVNGKTALEPETDMWLEKHQEMVQLVGNTSKAAQPFDAGLVKKYMKFKAAKALVTAKLGS